MNKNIKRLLKFVLFLAILIVLYFVLRKIGFSNIYSNLLAAEKIYLLLAFLSTLAAFLVWNLKWYLVTRQITKVNFWHLFLVSMAGSFVNTTTPGARVGGEPLKAYYLSRKYKLEKSKFFATAIADKAVNTIAFIVLSVLSILFVIFFVNISTKIKILLEIVLVVLFALAVAGIILKQKARLKREYLTIIARKIYYFPLFKALRKKFATYKHFERYVIKKLNNIVNVLKRTLQNRKVLSKDILLAFARWVFIYFASFFLFKSFGYDISFFAIVVVITLSIFVGSMMLVPGGMGFIETIMISLYIAFGIDSGVAATVAVIDRFIFYFYSLVIGGICLAYLSIKYK